MEITTLKVPGVDALRILAERRAQFAATGEYPFLIGSGEEIEQLQETADFNTEQPAEIIRSALRIQVDDWFAACRERAEKHNDAELILGDWPRSIPNLYRSPFTPISSPAKFCPPSTWASPRSSTLGNFLPHKIRRLE